MVPSGARGPRTAAETEFVAAVKLEVDGNFARALPFMSQPSMRQGPLGLYAEYYTGLAQVSLGRLDQARRTFGALQAKEPVGFLAEAAALREAECHTGLGDHAAAQSIYERLAKGKATAPDDLLMRLGKAARLAGSHDKANQAFARVYYEFPLSDLALSAGAELGNASIAAGTARYTQGLARAERLFDAKRYAQARNEFEVLRPAAQGDDRELVGLRIAESDYFLKRVRNARTALKPYLEGARRQGEALFFHALTLRALNEEATYRQVIRRIVEEFPKESWADEALNDLATFHIRRDEDVEADEVLRELYRRFPTGRNGDRAAWKTGWWSYKNGNHADAARIFERASADFPRSDYRPMWLYWAGRAHEARRDLPTATARYALATTDYGNSYYGRLAAGRLAAQGVARPERPLVIDVKAPTGADPPTGERPASVPQPQNAPTIRALLALDLYDQAVDELKYAQKVWANSSAIEATLAWAYWRQGRTARGSEQFNRYRAAINAMKRAYPHYLAAGGDELPAELLRVIFPLAYWDDIRKYAAQYGVDPYVSAALIAQESTFVPDIKSYANAWGLTQLRPGTARQYARSLKIRYTTKLLTDPEDNLRVGMFYFANKIKEFGQVHLAIASYNAGERPVRRWVKERPDVPQDEFIDDIPYPETNGYVKKILGTAEDYRRLYGPDARLETIVADVAPSVAAKAPPARAKVSAPPKSRKPATASKRPTPKQRPTRKAS